MSKVKLVVEYLSKLTGCLFLILCFPISGNAEQKQVYGDYEIHYMALASTFLDADIAKQYGITRSKASALLNVSILKKQPDGSLKSVSAFVKGSITNMVQQRRELEFKRVSEGLALYYLANFWYSQNELMTFRLEVQPDPNQPPFSLRFSQTLYPE